MRRYLYIIALFVFVIVSCTPDEIGTPFLEGQEVTITASMANRTSNAKQMPGKQRVSGKDAGATIDLTWNAGDEILVSVGDKSAVFTLSSGENTSAGEFRGKMPADGTEYSVSYPVDYSDDVLTHQTYVENGFGNGLMKMSTRTNGTLEDGFVLSADNAVLGLQLTGSQTLGEIVLTNTATTKTYTLHCDGVALTAEAILFYIVVPVKDWANGMRVEVYDNDGDIILMKEKAGEIMFSATDAMVMPALQTRERGKRIGIFSVGEGKYVSFSQGNLQYQQSTDEWCFAREQYECIGAENIKDGALADKIDLFGWSGKDTKVPWGVGVSSNYTDYQGEFVDWGSNTISGDVQDTWRTLSIEEWEYIYHGRKNADQLLALATLEGVQGLVLLPDNWQQPEDIPFVSSVEQGLAWDATRLEGSYFDATNKDHTKDNIYTQAQWQKMEALGAVFLPCAGWRQEKSWTHAGIVEVNIKYLGSYWSCSTPQISNDYYFFRFTQQEIRKFPLNNSLSLLARGRSVRLVHDTIVSKVEPEYVDLGLSVKWATFNVGATSPEDYGDYFAWGETEPKDEYSWKKYKWSKGTGNNITITKYNSTDSKHVLEPGDDAAHVHWGGKWRMPTVEEQTELREQCIWTWTSINGIWGHLVTGPNGKSIFLPAAGNITNTDLSYANVMGYQWSSSVKPGICAHRMHFSKNIIEDYDGGSRACGASIRPVYDDRPKSKIIWYTDEAIKEGSSVCLLNMAGWAYLHPEGMETTELNRLYQGKRINCIRLQVARAGTFTVSVANRDRLDSIFNIQTIMLKNPSKEPQVYHLPQTIHLQMNQVLVFSSPTDQGKFYYTHNGDITFADYVGHPDMKVRIADGPKTLNIDAGYYCEDRDNCDTTAIPEPPEL